MSDFVNYSTRGVSLPPGCKDLLDVLNLPREETPHYAALQSGAQPERMKDGILRDLEANLGWLISYALQPSFLAIRVGSLLLQLRCETVAGPLDLYLVVPPNEAKQAESIRAFFRGRDQDAMLDCPGPGGWQILRFRVPCVVGRALDLLRSLLKEACGVLEFTPLQFMFGRHPGGLW